MTTRQAGVCWRASHFTRAVRLGQTPHARCAPRTPPEKRCQAGTAPASPIRRRRTQTASIGRINFWLARGCARAHDDNTQAHTVTHPCRHSPEPRTTPTALTTKFSTSTASCRPCRCLEHPPLHLLPASFGGTTKLNNRRAGTAGEETKEGSVLSPSRRARGGFSTLPSSRRWENKENPCKVLHSSFPAPKFRYN